MVGSDPPSSPSPSPRTDATDEGPWTYKNAKLNLWSAIGVAAVTGLLSAVTAYIAKPGGGEAVPPSPPPSTERPTVRFDPVGSPVGLCNVFNGTGKWDSEKADLLLFNRPWDKQTKTGTDNYYLDGPATRLADGTWKGPRQELGRDTERGFAVEVSAVVVSHPWAVYLLDKVTSPEGRYWAVKELPPHETVATVVVTRDGTTNGGC